MRVGFIGLGNMGRPMATNVTTAGHEVVGYDVAGTESRLPDGARAGASTPDVARQVELVVLSLPSVASVESVVAEIEAAGVASHLVVADASTIGPDAARAMHRRLAACGVEYVDSPVSGLVFRAWAGTLTVMYSGATTTLERIRPVLESMSKRIFHVGDEPGQGQLMKLVNNALAISYYVTTSEAIAQGVRGGIAMSTLLEVINESSGQNFVATHVFPEHVLNERYASGATSTILEKDLSLFVEDVAKGGAPSETVETALRVVRAFAAADPLADQTKIYPFVRDRET